jgi:hypothetical protein
MPFADARGRAAVPQVQSSEDASAGVDVRDDAVAPPAIPQMREKWIALVAW